MLSMSQKMDPNKRGQYYYILKDNFAIEANLGYIHLNEFSQASKFDLNKWIKHDKNGNLLFFNNIESMPFSFGRRDCAGRSFALKEIYLLLANLIVNYKFEVADPTVKIQFTDALVKIVKPEIPVHVRDRNPK